MISPGDTVCVALSGGPDSVALLFALAEMSSSLKCKVKACHYDHAFRADSQDDMRFALETAGRLGIEVVTERNKSGKPGASIQQTGRELRYAFFEHLLDSGYADLIATGHTMDDSVETSVMWMLRGAGPSAFGGVPAVRGRFIRLLIDLRKRDLLAWLVKKGISYRQDPSNETDDYLRNRVRHHIIPAMENEALRVVESIYRLAEMCREQSAVIEDLAKTTIQRLTVRSAEGLLVLDPTLLSKERRAVRWSVYREALKSAGLDPSRLSFEHIGSVDDLSSGGGLGREIDLPEGFAARIDHAGLTLWKRAPVSVMVSTPFRPQLEIRTNGGLLTVGPYALDTEAGDVVDAGKIPSGAVLRTRGEGDYLHLKNLEGRKKLKKFLIDRKAPSGERDQMPLLAVESEILWVPGLFLSPSIAPDENSKDVVVLRWVR